MSGKLTTRLKACFGAAVLAGASLLAGCAPDHGKAKPAPAAAADTQSRTAAAKDADRSVRLYGPVDLDMADAVKAKLRALDAADPGKPITLVVTSTGGFVPPGLDIIDTMAHLKSPVNTLCERWCTSIAAVITASGDHRSAQPHAIMRFHKVQLDDDAQLRNLEEQQLLDILSQHSGRPKAEWAKVFTAGKFISARQAVDLGALDEVQKPGRPAPAKLAFK